MRKESLRLAVLMIALFVLAVPSFGTTISDIQISLDSTKFYFANGDFFRTDYTGGGPATNKIGPLAVGGSWDYELFGGNFEMAPSALIADQTAQNGGLAKGLFASGATLTISGDLYNYDYELIASGDLIVANVTSQWTLEEQPYGYPANTLRAQLFFDIVGGSFFDGSNEDNLILGDFSLQFTFERCTPAVTNFAGTSSDYSCVGPSVQIAPIPEPGTMVLLGLGALSLIRRRCV